MLSTSRFDDAGISMRVVQRSGGPGGITYVVEVTSDTPRPNAVLHWAVNDWTLPPQVRQAGCSGWQSWGCVRVRLGGAGTARNNRLSPQQHALGVPLTPTLIPPLAAPAIQENWPAGTQQAGDKAVQTPLTDGTHLSIMFPEVGWHQWLAFLWAILTRAVHVRSTCTQRRRLLCCWLVRPTPCCDRGSHSRSILSAELKLASLFTHPLTHPPTHPCTPAPRRPPAPSALCLLLRMERSGRTAAAAILWRI